MQASLPMQQKVDDYVFKELKCATLNPVRQIKHSHPLLHILFLTSFDLVLLFFTSPGEVHLYVVGDKSKLLNGDVQSVLYVAAVVSAFQKSFPSSDLGGRIHSKGDTVKIFTVFRAKGNCFFRVLTESKVLKPFSIKWNEEVFDVWCAKAFYIIWVVPHHRVSPGILFQFWHIHHFQHDCLMLCVKIVLMTNSMQILFFFQTNVQHVLLR